VGQVKAVSFVLLCAPVISPVRVAHTDDHVTEMYIGRPWCDAFILVPNLVALCVVFDGVAFIGGDGGQDFAFSAEFFCIDR